MADEISPFGHWLELMKLTDANASTVLEVFIEDVQRWKSGETAPPRHILLACSAYAAGLRPFS